MATRSSLKALASAFETLNTTNIVPGGNLRSNQLQNVITGIKTALDAVIDALFDNDNVQILTGTFSNASSFANSALEGVDLENTLWFVDMNEVSTGNWIDSYDSETGTANFSFAVNGTYKIYIFAD